MSSNIKTPSSVSISLTVFLEHKKNNGYFFRCFFLLKIKIKVKPKLDKLKDS
ncbi:hypothetical protein BPUTEOMOX_515 [methanotrophic endosymbiont of Bathymodiolus puteoserpentis (Logatchev)]|nr:hypothetical protein BPUTEOMOX_515 [methanotrophic endosymbiont of Bathymodiolus puteoserpentis (Logatchev)]